MTSNSGWIGKDLQEARCRKTRPDGKPWSRKDLAAAIGVSRRSVDSWERDEAHPQAHWVVKLNDLFGPPPGAEEPEDDPAGPRIKDASDGELLAELQLRYASRERRR